MNQKLIAYHGKKEIKEKYVQRMKDHIKADELIHGQGWTGSKGCAVGCTLNKYNHACYEDELGLPEWLARLEDTLFENMSLEKSKRFPLLLLKAIPIGADLTQIYHKFQIYILKDCKKNVKPEFDYVAKVIDDVIDLHEKASKGFLKKSAESAAWSAAESVRSAAWSAARSAAWSAAESAAESVRSAARLAAESAARLAAESAAWSARSAAWSARSAAWSAESAESARSAAFNRYADKLIELLRKSK